MNALSTLAGFAITVAAVWGVSAQLGAQGPEDAARSLSPRAAPYQAGRVAPRPARAEALAGVALQGLEFLEISGRVVNTRGEPVTGAVVVVAPADADPHASPSAVTDVEGKFVIRGLSPGSYSFTALHGSYPPNAGVDVALRADEDVFIVLDPDDLISA